MRITNKKIELSFNPVSQHNFKLEILEHHEHAYESSQICLLNQRITLIAVKILKEDSKMAALEQHEANLELKEWV